MRTDKKSRERIATRMAIGGLALFFIVGLFGHDVGTRAFFAGMGITLLFTSFWVGSTYTGDQS